MVCTIATAHRITQFRVVELFEAEKGTVTPRANQRQATVVRRPQATCCIVGHLNSQGSSHTRKTDDIEPRTAAFSGAVYNALLPTDPAFPTSETAAEMANQPYRRPRWPRSSKSQCGLSARFAAGRLAPGWSATVLQQTGKVLAGIGVKRRVDRIGWDPMPPVWHGRTFSVFPLAVNHLTRLDLL